MEDLDSSSGCALESIRDDGGVDALGQESVSCSEQTSADHNNRGCTVTSLNILSTSQVDQHLGGRVHNRHALEHGMAVVGDNGPAISSSNHLIHATRAEGGSDGIGDG